MLSFLKPGIGTESNLKNTGVKDGKKGLKFKIKLTIFFPFAIHRRKKVNQVNS